MKISSLQPEPHFELLGEHSVPSLNLHIAEYKHMATDARHLHLHTDSKENVFMVVLRTVPNDSTGVAHVLEHTVLCGSQRYKVRDPFFMMLRRSLNTFMNAFTGSDWTAYPFATQNYKDFDNLLQVYLDAVFFPLLDPLDFAQEGHRLERTNPKKDKSDLHYCGVVYNEMKGAMSSVTSQLWQALCAEMYPSSTYQYNSGGDPSQIPELSHEQLVAFHRRYYHPSNATFMTFGDILPCEHQAHFQELVLNSFERGDNKILVDGEHGYKSPRFAKTTYSAELDNLKDKDNSYLLMSWLLCDATDFESAANAKLVSGVLLDNSASPLRQLLEKSKLGKTPSSMTGLMDDHRELMLLCGIEGAQSANIQQFEEEVLAVLHQITANGVSLADAESVLHQYELRHREISGHGYPYGLLLLLRCLSPVLYRGDTLAALDLDSVLKRLRLKIKDSNFIPEQVQKFLIDNPRRLCLSAEPDPQLNERREREEQEKLRVLDAQLDTKTRANILQLSKTLKNRQENSNEQDADVLPKLKISDVPSDVQETSPAVSHEKPLPITAYSAATNGIAYQQVVLPIPVLNKQHQELLPLYTHCVTEFGIGAQDYLEAQKRQSAICGGLSCYGEVRSAPDNPNRLNAHIVFGTRSLESNASRTNELLHDTLYQVRFDEHHRLRELLSSMRMQAEENITQEGHQLVMNSASATLSPMASWAYENNGLSHIRRLKTLDKIADDDKALKNLMTELSEIHTQVIAQKPKFLLISEEESLTTCVDHIHHHWSNTQSNQQNPHFSPEIVKQARLQLWQVQTQVNFCARAWPTVPYAHADAPALSVLAALMRNGYLHRAIREQGGAYGGGAIQDSAISAFMCFSYRDPRLEETLKDFDSALDWLHNSKHSASEIEEAILGVVGSIDKPIAPAGMAIRDFHNRLYGYSHAQKCRYREAVLNTKIEDMLSVAGKYLNQDQACTAVIVPLNSGKNLMSKNYEVQTLNTLAPSHTHLVA